MDIGELFRENLDHLRTWTRTEGEEVPASFGVVHRNRDYPLVHMANLAWVDAPPEGGPAGVLAAMDEAFQGTKVPHRNLLFSDPAAAFASQDAFAALGFRATAELALAKVGLPVCIVNPEVEVREVGRGASEAEFRAVTEAVHREAGYFPEESRQVYQLDRLRAKAVGERAYVAFLKDAPAGTMTLWPRGRYALIGNVATVPEARMQGVGRTIVFEACKRAIDARCEYALLTADLLGTPKAMYETLGFKPVGEIRGFLRL